MSARLSTALGNTGMAAVCECSQHGFSAERCTITGWMLEVPLQRGGECVDHGNSTAMEIPI